MAKPRKPNKRAILGTSCDLLLVVGWALTSAGAWMISEPAGYIVAGVLAIAGGCLIGRGINR